MPELTPADAVRTLSETIRAMDLDDLRDAHNELFPETPIPPIDPSTSSQEAGIRQKVLDYLAGGIAVEEILDLWSRRLPGGLERRLRRRDRDDPLLPRTASDPAGRLIDTAIV